MVHSKGLSDEVNVLARVRMYAAATHLRILLFSSDMCLCASFDMCLCASFDMCLCATRCHTLPSPATHCTTLHHTAIFYKTSMLFSFNTHTCVYMWHVRACICACVCMCVCVRVCIVMCVGVAGHDGVQQHGRGALRSLARDHEKNRGLILQSIPDL